MAFNIPCNNCGKPEGLHPLADDTDCSRYTPTDLELHNKLNHQEQSAELNLNQQMAMFEINR